MTVVLARFAAADGPDLDEHIPASLREIAEFVGVDYAFVIQLKDNLTTWSVTHEWAAPGLPSNSENYQNVPFGTAPWAERVLLAGDAVVVNSLEDAPPEAAAEREMWESLDGVWEWDAASEQVQYSDRFAELLGHTAADVPQTLEFFRSILHPDDSESLWAAVDRHLNEGVPYDVECRLKTKTGEYRWFRTRGQVQRDSEGRPTWMAGSLQDVDDQKTAEAELRRALREVERLSDRLRAENVYLQEEIAGSRGFDEIVGESEPLRLTLSKIEHVADTDASVLLLGETGTGKELLARAIHHHSRRKDRPLVKVNLAALPSSLIESELFGHVKGAFTGAVSDKVGRFELADGGTLFLDEIGELNPDLQTKLLRVLQKGEFERIGRAERFEWTSASWQPPIATFTRPLSRSVFGPICTIALPCFPSKCPRCDCGATIFRCLFGTSFPRSRRAWGRPSTGSPKR